jgi:hypothetical protein
LDLGVYEFVLKQSDPVDSDTVAKGVGAEPALMRRILRFLANFGHISEVGVDSFTSNVRTPSMASTKFVNCMPIVYALEIVCSLPRESH